MKIRAIILTGSVFVAMSTPLALAGNGKHENDRSSGFFQVWIQAGWGQENHYRGCGEACWSQPPGYYGGRGLPPGLAKRDRLPPGLEKHLLKHGSLPPGLQKKIDPYGWKGGKKNRGGYEY